MKNRRGIIKVSESLITDEISLLVFANFAPIKTDYHPWNETITYYGYSPLFDEVKEGEVAPEYSAVVETVNGVDRFKEFVKL